MFLHVTAARHVRDNIVEITFNDGMTAHVDLSDSLDGPIFKPLKDIDYFRSFSIEGHTISWPNGADFAPEYLRSLASAAVKP